VLEADKFFSKWIDYSANAPKFEHGVAAAADQVADSALREYQRISKLDESF
jgi:hypothetical protein